MCRRWHYHIMAVLPDVRLSAANLERSEARHSKDTAQSQKPF